MHLGLQTSSNSRPHVEDRNHHISLHAHTQRDHHLPLLDPVLSGRKHSMQRAMKKQNKNTSTVPWKCSATTSSVSLCLSPLLWAHAPTSSSRTPERWWRSWSRRGGRRRRVDSRYAACWSRGPGSRWGPWSPRAWGGVDWASPIPCCTRNLCTWMSTKKSFHLQ